MITHTRQCKLFKRKKHNFQVWCLDGEPFIDRADKDDTEEYTPECKFVRQFKATDYLRAEQIAFGVLPPLDAGIAELVFAVNDVPGLMTEHSCMGHLDRGNQDGYVLFYADDSFSLHRFGRILSCILHDDEEEPETEPPLQARIEYCMSQLTCSEAELRMVMRMTGPEESSIPSADAYRWLAREIRRQLAILGFRCEAGCTSQEAPVLEKRSSGPQRADAGVPEAVGPSDQAGDT